MYGQNKVQTLTEQESGFICHKVVLEQGAIPVILIITQQWPLNLKKKILLNQPAMLCKE